MKTIRKKIPLRALGIILSVLLQTALLHAQTTPVAQNGQLSVCGTRLCNQYGNPIQLRGMSTHGLQWYGWGSCVTEASLDALAYNWGADVLRISLYVQEGGYETDPAGFTAQVSRIIDEATERGMYALVDWHQLSPGDPNANLANARRFFTDIANAHKNKNNIIYDICNEPNEVSWSRIKTYADQIIPVIRAIDSDAVILIGTHGWASLGISDGRTAQDIVSNPVTFSNIMYTFHFYATSHRDEYLNELSWAADRLPMFVTEFGTQEYTGDGPNDFTMSQRYIDLMRQKKISWTSWNYSDDFRSGAAWKSGTCSGGPWTVANLKPAGQWVRERILSPADDFPGGGNQLPVVSITSPSNGTTFSAPASVTINATATDSDGTVAKVEFFQGATKLGEDLTSPYSFSWNNVAAGSYSLTAKATDDDGAVKTSSAVNITVQAAPGCTPVTASSDDGNIPANVLDGNLSTRWSANGDGQWIQFCLDTEKTVSGVKIAFYNGNVRTSTFDVLTSLNGTDWTTAAGGLTSSGTSLNLEIFTFTARTAKHVRIVGHGNSVNAWNSYTEVSITIQTPTTCTAPVTASADDGNVPANVLDNNLNTRWSASGDGQWIQLCLDGEKTVNGVQIAFYNGNTRTSTFDVLSSLNGTSWSNAATGLVSSGTSLNLETFTFSARTAKYVRIVGHGNSVNAWNSYTEVKVSTTTSFARTEESASESFSVSSYPNPSAGQITVKYNLKEAGHVRLSIHNTVSNQTTILLDDQQSAGEYQSAFDVSNLPEGVYVVKLISNGKTKTQRLVKR